MKPWIYIFITTEKLNFAKMSVTTLLHSHDELFTVMRITCALICVLCKLSSYKGILILVQLSMPNKMDFKTLSDLKTLKYNCRAHF